METLKPERDRKETTMTTMPMSSQTFEAVGAQIRTPAIVENLRRAWTDYKSYRHLLAQFRAISPDLREDQGLTDTPERLARIAVYGK
jgi:hypothetical protein